MVVSDFIIVGGGPAGCALASGIARTPRAPLVTLIEAGGDNSDLSLRVTGERYETFMTQAALNWGYKTVPQEHAKGRQIDYSRGRGLGGSSAINFSVFVYGPRDDYEEWARLVDDDTWNWANTQQRFKRIVTYEHVIDPSVQRYFNPVDGLHGDNGPVRIGFPDMFERGIVNVIDAAEELGLPTSKDLNTGNPIGLGIPPSSSSQGLRSTAASSYLVNPPKNLIIITNTPVTRIIFDGLKATGVESHGEQFFASKEVILSAGAIDSPKILLLSGIGPAEELKSHRIPVLKEIPGVGKHLLDHNFVPLTIVQTPTSNDRLKFFNDTKAVVAAREQWLKDHTGPLASFYSALTLGWFKSPTLLQSEEFAALPESVKEFLVRETIPHFEIGSGGPYLPVETGEIQPHETSATFEAFWMNNQAVGSVRLQSSNPSDLPLIDPNILSHPYDRRIAIECVRTVMKLFETPLLKENTLRHAAVPRSKSDEDIFEYVQQNALSSWHMCSTLKMGRPDDPDACVDKDFRVVGLQNLRVVDMSVAPIIPNTHTQATAYLIGEVAAEKLIRQYGLGS